MSNLIKLLGIELQEISLFLLITTIICFVLISLISRLIVNILPLKNHHRLIWVIDVLLLPSAILVFNLLVTKMIGTDSQALIADIDAVTAALLWLIGAWLLNRGLQLFVWKAVFINLTGTECPGLLRNLISIVIYLLAVYGILTFVFKHPVTGLVVSTGIVAGVLGLSLQSVLSDLFAGLALTIERPYKIGDWIEFKDGTIGKVIDVGWRTTRLLSFNNSVFIVPNKHAVNSVIHNYDMPEQTYATWFNVSVESNISPRLVQQLLLEAALNCKSVLDDPLPAIRVSDATGQPFKYLVWVYFKDYTSQWAGKSDLFETMQTYLSKSGISPSAVKYEIASGEAKACVVEELGLWQYLRRVDIFQPLSDEEVKEIAGFSESQIFMEGQVLIREGEAGSSLFVIISGIVAVLKQDDKDQDQEIELARLGVGNFVGEMSLLTGEPRAATVRAITPVTAIEVTKEGMHPLLKAQPDLSNKLAVMMAKRRFRTKEMIESRGTQHASELMLAYARDVLKKIKSFFSLS